MGGGGGPGFSSSQQSYSMTSGGMGGGGPSKMTSVSTITRNGKTVKVKKTTFTDPNGQKRTEVEEEVLDGGNRVQGRKYLKSNPSAFISR